MRNIVLIAGMPGVGKSTLAHEIAKKASAAVLDVDDFKRDIVDPTLLAEEIDPPEVRAMYYNAMLKEAFRVLENDPSSSVVVDEVFHLRHLRREIVSVCAKRRVRVLWVEVTCAYETVEKRLAAKERGGHILSSEKTLEMYRRFAELFEAFEADENHLLIGNEEDSPEDLAELVLAKMPSA